MAHSIASTVSRKTSCPAKTLTGPQRQDLAVQAIAGSSPISTLADRFQVSRKFVYQQTATAQQALDDAFHPHRPADNDLLFLLPVTKPWLQQLMLGLVLHCHSSYRGAQALVLDLFDTSVSLGTIHHVLDQAVLTARCRNAQQDLSAVRIGAHDEICQSGQPVLVGADVDSTYCYLLSLEQHRDADTWGVRLLELEDQGLRLEPTIADGGQGLRAGQALAWPEVPCRGDVFHALRDVGQLVTFLENRAHGVITARDQQQRRMARAKRRGRGHTHSKRLALLRQQEAQAVCLVDDVALLARWLRDDVLAVAGPDHATRCQLFDFLVAELESRQPLCPHRIAPVVCLLKNQRDALLAFAVDLDEQLAALAHEYQVAPTRLRELLLLLETLDLNTPARWQREAELRLGLGSRFRSLRAAVRAVADQVVRASSVIENLNSRLRNYFFLRRQLGPEYLELLRFFLNHRCFPRSAHAERVGKSPAESLNGQRHAHWLELLGYQRFERN